MKGRNEEVRRVIEEKRMAYSDRLTSEGNRDMERVKKCIGKRSGK